MNGITVSMAIIDFIPVALFFIASVLLQRDLYGRLYKGAFALLATGSVMVLTGGFFKALWKVLYALNICDYTLLDHSFFPMQGVGFLLFFMALISLFMKKGDARAAALAVPVYSGGLPFVALQTLGCGGAQWCLFALSLRMKKAVAAAFFALSFVSMLGMGYLSATFDDTSNMHWLAQCVNILSQGAFLAGVVILHKNGLKKKA